MTQTEAAAWLNGQVGKFVDWDGQYGSQCVDLWNAYYYALTARNPYSDGYGVPGAKDLWNVATSRFTKIPDSASLVPQPGDVLIYGSSWGGGYGHVEMVVANSSTGVTIVGANLSGNSAIGVQRVFRTWGAMRGLIGVMRFNGFTQPVTGEVMNDDTARQIAYHYLGRNGFDGKPNGLSAPQELQGRPLTNAELSSIFLSPESRAWREAKLPQVFTERDSLRAENASLKQTMADLQTALANEQAKPPREVIKEVEKIITVEKPVEVIVEVEPTWLKAVVAFIRKVLHIS